MKVLGWVLLMVELSAGGLVLMKVQADWAWLTEPASRLAMEQGFEWAQLLGSVRWKV